MAQAPNKAVLLAMTVICAVCAGVVALLAYTIILTETGSLAAAWTGVAITVGIVALLLSLLMRLRNKADA